MSSKKNEDGPTLPPCRICGRRGTGLHFGVITCEACKEFYKRSRKRQRPFECRGQQEKGKCEIEHGKPPLCSYCRLQMCAKVGMSRESIIKGRCTIEKKAELMMEARKHQQDTLRQNAVNQKRGIAHIQNENAVANKTNHVDPSPMMLKNPEPLRDSNHVTQLNASVNDLDQTENQTCPDATSTPNGNVETKHTSNVLPRSSYQIGAAEPQHVPFAQGCVASKIQQYEQLTNPTFDDSFDFANIAIIDVSETAYSFSGQRLMEILVWIDSVVQADMETQLFDDEETDVIQSNNTAFKESKTATEDLLGSLKTLPHEVYAEVYEATGIDVDEYREKPGACIADADDDIFLFIEFLRRIPKYGSHDLNDRLRLTKGGYPGWMLLSCIEIYDSEGDCMGHSATSTVVWTGGDYSRYFGPDFTGFTKKTIKVFQDAGLTSEELAVLKMFGIYRDRPYLGPKGSGDNIQEQQDLINDALLYLFESKRGKENGRVVLDRIMDAMEVVEHVTEAVVTNVRQMPKKFPDLPFPRIWLEINGCEEEEELVVAVSTGLRITD